MGDTYVKKNLEMIPARLAIALQESGWILRNDIIWFKPNHMPSSVKDRLTNTYEHLFHFVKTRRYYYDLDSIRVAHKTGPARFNYRVREAKKGHYAIAGIQASQREIEEYNVKGERTRGLKTKGQAQLGREQYHGEDVNYHHKGKNPGDVLYNSKFDKKCQGKRLSQSLAYARKVLGREHETALNHPLGKNPGDVLEAVARDTSRHHGSGPANTRHGKIILSHPLGVNPGDVLCQRPPSKYKGRKQIRQDNNLGGNVGVAEFRERCRKEGLPEGHPSGKNPGDVVDLSPETRSKEKLLKQRRRELAEMRKKGKIHWELHPSKDQRWFGKKGKNPTDFWTTTTKGFPGAHFAVYPEALCVRPVLSSCPARGVVLDPFLGSGTTMKVALELGRSCIGIELNPAYVPIIKMRLRESR